MLHCSPCELTILMIDISQLERTLRGMGRPFHLFTISYPGTGTAEEAKIVSAEDISRYLEQFFFGILPAWGAYIRHAKDIEFKKVVMTAREPDARERIVLDDDEGFQEN